MIKTSSNALRPLSDEQHRAASRLLSFPKRVQTLGGFAGTGKTTVIRYLKEKLPDFAVCAFTGKAANVLRRKGMDASTIHSLIYAVLEQSRIDTKGKPYVDRQWLRRDVHTLDLDGFIVDEASMVNRQIYDDLMSYKLPIIFVGDHGQLEPVGGDNPNLMLKPDVVLETVHRNAGDIERFANFLRRGGAARDWHKSEDRIGDKVQVVSRDRIGDYDLNSFDQFICAYNLTRVAFNKMVREELGFLEDKPAVGDRVMCLQNDRQKQLFNGMQGAIVSLDPADNIMDFRDTGGQTYRVRFLASAFNQEKRPEQRTERIPFDYCYAATCHKCQGDEFDNVIVLEQRCSKWSHTRWAYTAASRAKQRLVWVAD